MLRSKNVKVAQYHRPGRHPGISLDGLVEKEDYPVPEKLLPQVIDGLRKSYPDGILASGADGLRFTLASLSGQGRDIKLDIRRVEGYRAFLNKIWNATRFALMRVTDGEIPKLDDVRDKLNLADRWILSRLQPLRSAPIRAFKHATLPGQRPSITFSGMSCAIGTSNW